MIHSVRLMAIDRSLIKGRHALGMNKTWLMFLTVAALVAAPGSALTVDDAVKQARENNLGLQGEDLKLAQKTDEKNYSFNKLYPTLSASTTLMRLNNLNLETDSFLWDGIFGTLQKQGKATYVDSSAFTNSLTSDYNWIWSLGLKAQWVLSPVVFQSISQTLVDYQTARVTRDSAAAKLDQDVRKAFYQLLALHEATNVFESQLKVAEDRWKLAKLNFDAGLGSEIAALQAQVTYVNRKPVLDDQTINENNAQAGFRILLNLPDGAPLNLDGTLDVAPEVRKVLANIDVDALVKRYLDGRWDVGLIQSQVESLKSVAKLQADTLWPTFILGFTMDPSVQAPFASQTWNNSTYSQYNFAQTNGALSMTLDWKLDSFIPGSSTAMTISAADRQAREAQLAADQTRRAGENDIRTLVARLKKAAVSVDSLAVSLDLAQRSAKLTEDGYQAGTQSYNDAQDADQNLQTARLQYLNEELALQSALADLDYALAADRKEWLHG